MEQNNQNNFNQNQQNQGAQYQYQYQYQYAPNGQNGGWSNLQHSRDPGRSKSISYYRRSRSVQKIKTGDPGYRKRTERSGNRRGKIFQTVCDSEI